MYVEPESPRYSIETTPRGLRAVVPARRHWFVLLFISVWLVAWALGELHAVQELLSPTEKTSMPFLLVWLAGWTLGGAYAVVTLIWQLAGSEIISIDDTALEHRVEALGVGRSRAYKASEVKNLRATDCSSNPLTNQAGWFPPLGSGVGAVAFDYGAKTLRLAPALEEADARSLVEALASRLPRKLG